jgi:ankyrin repeat protein
MKMLKIFCALALACGTLAVPAATADHLTEALQKGLLEEEANQNLEAAIEAYQSVIQQSAEQRRIIATALYRLGECYRKQSKTALAAAQYERLLAEYTDQTILANLCRQNLVALNASTNRTEPGKDFKERILLDTEAGEVKRIQVLIKDSPDLINVPGADGLTPLGKAARDGQQMVAKFLLESHADLELKGSGKTPLHWAAQSGHKAMVDLLLQHGASVNARADQTGATALLLAANKGFKTIVQVLLDQKADIHIPACLSGPAEANGNSTALHYAAGQGLKTVAELLLDHGADVNALNQGQVTPLYKAVAGDHLALAELLVRRGADANRGDHSPLFLAVANGSEEMVRFLLENHASPQVKESFDHLHNVTTPLHVAVIKNNLPLAACLLKFKADPNATELGQATPLHLAVALGEIPLAELLLKQGADPNRLAQNVNGGGWNGSAPLMLVLPPGNFNRTMAELLVRHGANVNFTIINDANRTLLHQAALRGQRDAVDFLVNAGAEVNVLDEYGSTPLDYAKGSTAGTLPRPGIPGLLPGVMPPPPGIPGAPIPARINRPSPGGEANPEDPAKNQSNIQALLRTKGAMDDLQRRNFISANRGNDVQRMFKKTPEDWNRYTLFQLMAQIYQPAQIPSHQHRYRFPELSQITIKRIRNQAADAPNLPEKPRPALSETNLLLNLEAALKMKDRTKDVLLEWGDIVEIPESDHPINQQWSGLDHNLAETLAECLKREVQIIVKGKTNLVSLSPSIMIGSAPSIAFNTMPTLVPYAVGDSSVPQPKKNLATFALYEVVFGADVLRASSDITRISVKRASPGQPNSREWTFNLEKRDPANTFLLQDGDRIEIPEKTAAAEAAKG